MVHPVFVQQDLHNSSWRQESGTHDFDDLVDRISALPDSILGLILSLLPTKNVVATSVISKRWKFVWMTVDSLDFYHDTCMKKEEADYVKFAQFVNRMLLLPDAGLLNKFHLVCEHCCISPEACSWINTAITRNVHDVYVNAQFDLPLSVFSCNSLQSLELKGRVYVPAEFEVFLPRLESIKLVNVFFRSEEGFDKLISGCPVLKSMYLRDARKFTSVISSTSLTRLDLYIMHYNLELDVPSLEYLRVTGVITGIFVQKNLTSLVEAHFLLGVCPSWSENSIVEAVRSFDRVKVLSLSAYVMTALSRAGVGLSTQFKRLVKLETITDHEGSIALQNLIQNADNLEFLKIYQVNQLFRYDNHPKWDTLVQVPRCLSNTLKKIVVGKCKDDGVMSGMICYMLKHGGALEVMELHCRRFFVEGAQLRWVKEIRESPRKSPTCQVTFGR